MSENILPQFGAGSLEDLLIAVIRLQDSSGRAVIVRPQDIFTEELLRQIPAQLLTEVTI